jgi:hypothetical protein
MSYRAMMLGLKPTNLGELKALLAAIDTALQAVSKDCATAATSVKLRLTIDKAGKVAKVEVLASKDDKLADCLKKKLASLSSATKPTADSGTLEFTVNVVAFRGSN